MFDLSLREWIKYVKFHSSSLLHVSILSHFEIAEIISPNTREIIWSASFAWTTDNFQALLKGIFFGSLFYFCWTVRNPFYIHLCPAPTFYYARSKRSERSAQLLAFKRENSIYSRTKNSHFSMCPFRGCGFTYEKKHHFHVSIFSRFEIVEVIGPNTREIIWSARPLLLKLQIIFRRF